MLDSESVEFLPIASLVKWATATGNGTAAVFVIAIAVGIHFEFEEPVECLLCQCYDDYPCVPG